MKNNNSANLIRIASYPKHEDADIARAFLQHRGITTVVVPVDHSAKIEDDRDQFFAGGTFDLLVPAIESAKAITLLSEQWRIDEGGSNLIGDVTNEELNIF